MPDIFASPPTQPIPEVTSTVKSPGMVRRAVGTYLFMPEGVKFETQEAGETIILLLRKHWITNLSWIILSVMLILIPPVFFPLLLYFKLLPVWIPGTFLTALFYGWYLITLSYILVEFLLWYFTVSIVTNERVIDIDFANILNKKFAETRISRVEDVTERTGGFIRTLFNYGDVLVQTAGSQDVFEFAAVPRPVEVVHIINQLMERVEEGGTP
jgi:membrane protein YdbS with pleckstrin-like domain